MKSVLSKKRRIGDAAPHSLSLPLQSPKLPATTVKNGPESIFQKLNEEQLFQALSFRKPTRVTIEPTVFGAPATTADSTIPSFFCYYPHIKRKVNQFRSTGDKARALKWMRQCIVFLATGNKALLVDPDEEPQPGTEENPILIEGSISDRMQQKDRDGAIASTPIPFAGDAGKSQHSEQEERATWQISAGEDGWFDFDPQPNDIIEQSHSSGKKKCRIVATNGQTYEIQFGFMIQQSLSTGTVRPIRRTTL